MMPNKSAVTSQSPSRRSDPLPSSRLTAQLHPAPRQAFQEFNWRLQSRRWMILAKMAGSPLMTLSYF
jgi:hypothetical protein